MMYLKSVSRPARYIPLITSVILALCGMRANSEVLFHDDFDGTTAGSGGWVGGVATTISTAAAKDSDRSLQFYFEGGIVNSFSEQRFSLGGHYSDIWVKYDILIPDNYFHENRATTNNNKGFLYLWSGEDYASPNGPGMGPNFWPTGDGASGASIYLWGPGLDQHLWGVMPEAIELSDRGQWITIISHYAYATSANNDGVAEMWKLYSNGTLKKILDVRNGPWYVEGQLGYSHGYLLGWANSGFAEDTYFHIDNVVMADHPLLVKPETPRSLSVSPAPNP